MWGWRIPFLTSTIPGAAPGIMEVRKGMRHPHINICSALRTLSKTKITNAATVHAPKAPVAEIHDKLKPSVSDGETSLMYTAAVDISPPVLRPCNTRHSRRAARPNQPQPSPQQLKD